MPLSSPRFLLGISVCMLSAAPAFAQNMGAVKTTPLTGPYVGIYGGYGWTDTSIRATPDPDPNGWDMGVFAGYKLDALLGGGKDYGIGANGAVEIFYGDSQASNSVGGVRVEKNNEWGVSFRPGLSVLDKVTGDMGLNPYGILGYRNTEFETSGLMNRSDRFDGFELGIGTEVVAAGNAGLRLEYSHVWYASENGIDPDSDALRLGLSYHF